MAPAPDRAGLGQERHQGRDDQDGLVPLAHEQHERLREEVRARAAVGDQPLGALEARQQAGVNRVELVASRTRSRPRAQAGERVLELARESGIPGAHVRLDLLEGEVRVERDLVGAQRHRRVELTPHGRERGGRRRCPVPLPLGGRNDAEERDEARRLPGVERGAKARHRRTRPALQDEPRELLVGEAPECREVAQGRRPHRKGLRERTITSPARTMARRALRGVQPLALAHHHVIGTERRHVAGHRPPVFGGQRLLELRHRRARDTDRELPVHVHRGHRAHCSTVGEARGRRSFELAGLRAVALARGTVTLHALLPKHRRAAGDRRRPPRIGIEGASRRGGDPLHQRSRPLGHGVGRGHAIDHCLEGREVRVCHDPDGGGQGPDVQPRLLQELSRLGDLLGHGHTAAPRRDPDRILFGGERGCRHDPPGHGQRIHRLAGRADCHGGAQEQS